MPFNHDRIREYPLFSGVYLMRGGNQEVLYVGKAKVLRDRLFQYFRGQDDRPQIPYLLAQVEDIECIITGSEKEAILLENRLIKKYKPRYNILLKDDKTQLRIVLTKHDYPRLELRRTREQGERQGRHVEKELVFSSVAFMRPDSAREMFDLTAKLFKIRQCSDAEFSQRTRPCILHGIKRCSGPCCKLIDQTAYRKDVMQAIGLLKGENKMLQESLKNEIEEASEVLDFERAQSLHTTLKTLEGFLHRQDAGVVKGAASSDVIGAWFLGDTLALFLLKYREGRLCDSGSWLLDNPISSIEEAVTEWIMHYYPSVGKVELPNEIVIPFAISSQAVQEALNDLLGSSVRLFHPVKGVKKELVEVAQRNAHSLLLRAKEIATLQLKQLVEVKNFFSLPVVPKIIDCFDTSHLSGSNHVATCVRFRDGKSDKSGYRTFQMQNGTPGDDYGMLSESVARRYQETSPLKSSESSSKLLENMPDLIVVDGGRGQLHAAVKTLELLQLGHIPVMAITKEKGRHDKGLTAEKIYVSGRQEPYELPKTHPLLLLFQNFRDEAHRFSIEFQRKKRKKQLLDSQLNQIPGIGKKRREQLLKAFGSVARVKTATVEELQKEGGMPKKVADLLYAFFHG